MNKMRASKGDRIDAEWAALIPKGWGTFGDRKIHSGERKVLHDLLEDDEHLEILIGGSFGPDLQALGGVGTILRAGSIHKGVILLMLFRRLSPPRDRPLEELR